MGSSMARPPAASAGAASTHPLESSESSSISAIAANAAARVAPAADRAAHLSNDRARAALSAAAILVDSTTARGT